MALGLAKFSVIFAQVINFSDIRIESKRGEDKYDYPNDATIPNY